ncbi:Uncharacterised protein [uncultured archaeon]|nr:Uncharacterised protein [uncultured archaeon]
MQTRENGRVRMPGLGLALLALAMLCAMAWSVENYTYPILSNEVHSTTRAPNSSLDIQLTPVCENEDHIEAQVLWKNQPVPRVLVSLYSYSGGRHLDSEVQTSEDGWAYFRIRPAGSYDMTARVVNDHGGAPGNTSFGQIYFKIPPCLSPPSGAPMGPVSDLPAPAAPFFEQSYAGGRARQFESIRLADGQEAVRVRLSAQLPEGSGPWQLVESIPSGMADSEQALGFEQNYPQEIRTGDAPSLRWTVDGPSGSRVERSYVMMRPLTTELARRWGEPALEKARVPLVNASGLNGSAGNSGSNADKANGFEAAGANAKSPAMAGSNASSNSSASSAQGGSGLPSCMGAGVLILALALLGALGWTMHARKQAPKKE